MKQTKTEHEPAKQAETPEPILLIGGFGLDWRMYQSAQQRIAAVSKQPTYIVPITLTDWINVALRDDYSVPLKRLDTTVQRVRRDMPTEKLTLVAHSAGGILARIYMGDQPYGTERLVFHGMRYVSTLVTLGTPHQTTKRGRLGGQNQIAFAQTHYPGACWPAVRYVSVIGQSVHGNPQGTHAQQQAWRNYAMLSDEASQWGDGIVPLSSGMLSGSLQIVLRGASHQWLPGRAWYVQNEETVQAWWGDVEQARAASIA